jgi:hypothetical protein
MGARADNYLVETFAVAVSYEVLQRMGENSYTQLARSIDFAKLPDQVQTQLNAKDWPALETYWQSGIPSQAGKPNDRPFQTLKRLYTCYLKNLRSQTGLFSGIAYFDDCKVVNSDFPTRICPPDLPRIAQLGLNLSPLGYRRH